MKAIYPANGDLQKNDSNFKGIVIPSSFQEEDVPQIGEAFYHETGFGDKNITFFGSCVLNFNNVTGPAVVVLPLLFQQAGWFLPTMGLTIMWVLSSLSASMLCESMQRIPGNHGFQKRYEYCTLVKHYFGNTWHYISQIGYNVGLTASNIAAMVICIQVMDSIVQWMIGSTYGISYQDLEFKFVKSLPNLGESDYCEWGWNNSGNCNTDVISVGFFMAMLVCIPFGMVNLDDNMWFQYFSMVGQLAFSIEFIVQFIYNITPGTSSYCPGNGPNRTPFIGSNLSQVIGICVFAYSYVSTIPSWVNEKQPKVNVNKSIWFPSLVGLVLNIFLGILGAMAFNLTDSSGTGLSGTDNILNVLYGGARSNITCDGYQALGATQFSVYMFGLFGYLPGIPILAIMVRYNLQNGKILGPRSSFFVAVIIPWLVAAVFYQKEMLTTFCNWFAILFQGFINLVFPPLLYRASLSYVNSTLDRKQKGSPHPLRFLEKTYSLDRLIDGLRLRMIVDKKKARISFAETNSISEDENANGVIDPGVDSALVWNNAGLDSGERSFLENLRLTVSILKSYLAKCSLKRLSSFSWMGSSNCLHSLADASIKTDSDDEKLSDPKQYAGIRDRNSARIPYSFHIQSLEGKESLESDTETSFSDDEIVDDPVDAIPPWLNMNPFHFSTVMAYFLLFMVLIGILVTLIQDLS